MDSEDLCNLVDQIQLCGAEKLTIGLPLADLCHADRALQNVILCKKLHLERLIRDQSNMLFQEFGSCTIQWLFLMLVGTFFSAILRTRTTKL